MRYRPEDLAALWWSEEALTAGLRDIRTAEERVLGELLATSALLSMNSRLNMVEGRRACLEPRCAC